MIIKILGSGCKRCEKLHKKVTEVVISNKIYAEIIKVDDIKEIAKYGILMTPGLVINEKLVYSINVPSEKDILKYIKQNS
ncbi:MAG: thioredoxin family protein [Ignavibacteriae bacterium]|nr:thioredoxin family protein [Ignavibacteriota bacterium]